MTVELLDGTTADDGRRRKGRTEHHALKRLAAAQRHVGLTIRERAGGIDDGMLESKALTLVNGNRPCQSHGILPEHTLHGFLYFLGLLIERIFCIRPFSLLQIKLLVSITASHHNLASVDTHHLSYHTVIEAVLDIILHKHDLCTLLQYEFVIGWV